ncbi:MAG: NAD/NADP octopine/nopaline dehydrogenase family protein [Candidatus Thorarchaeota archaeon]
MPDKLTILGAGHGGQGLAAYLALAGHEVCLYNRSKSRLLTIKKQKGIHVKGVVNGFARLANCTSDIQKALSDASLVFLVVPASAHRDIAHHCAPYLSPEHVVVLIPGRTGGALEFSTIVESLNGWRPIVGEAQTFPLVSRVIESGKAHVSAIKSELPVAAFPAKDTQMISELISSILPGVRKAEDVLETGLSNIGSVFHPAPLILNIGRAETTNGQFNHYLEGISPSIARFIEQIDAERVAIGQALGKDVPSAVEWLRKVYASKGNTLYEALHTTPCYQGLGAPNSLNHRYIFEDVPTGLVPIAAIGELVGVPTPTIQATITMASQLCGRDFLREGRNAENLGITDLSPTELMMYVWEGSFTAFEVTNELSWFPEEMEEADSD